MVFLLENTRPCYQTIFNLLLRISVEFHLQLQPFVENTAGLLGQLPPNQSVIFPFTHVVDELGHVLSLLRVP